MVNISKKTAASLTIEVPLAERQVVPYGFLLEDTADDTMEIPMAVGKDADALFSSCREGQKKTLNAAVYFPPSFMERPIRFLARSTSRTVTVTFWCTLTISAGSFT